ncbi:MAG: GTPase Era [Rhodothermales bacterium]
MNDEIENQDTVPKGHRSGYIALIGKPNVGKSTLINALVGQKMSIVTAKPQTTRHRVLGILSTDEYQAIFLDTPGVLEPKYKLHKAMMRNVYSAVEDADAILMLVDVREDPAEVMDLNLLKGKPVFLLINKIDLIPEKEALPIAQAYSEMHGFEDIIPISALKGSNLERLKSLFLSYLPEGPSFYPKEMISEHPVRFFVAEIIREKIFEFYSKEIPYSTQVNITVYEEREDKKDLIDAEIVIERNSQKGILIGKGGSALKRVGTAARKDIEELIGREVFLQLHVKVREGWRNHDNLLKSFGYGGS